MLYALVRLRNGQPDGWIIKNKIADVRVQAASLLGQDHKIIDSLRDIEKQQSLLKPACHQLDSETWLLADGFN